mmetsp:Transcript_11546/g.18847  ORF Transcript_11546/g.18847 Transcript_11546/m.18847 type:complete len:181 (+) Transcript_11546:108-650(+)
MIASTDHIESDYIALLPGYTVQSDFHDQELNLQSKSVMQISLYLFLYQLAMILVITILWLVFGSFSVGLIVYVIVELMFNGFAFYLVSSGVKYRNPSCCCCDCCSYLAGYIFMTLLIFVPNLLGLLADFYVLIAWGYYMLLIEIVLKSVKAVMSGMALFSSYKLMRRLREKIDDDMNENL